MAENAWRCVGANCDYVLGFVVGGEFIPSEGIGGKLLQTRGSNLVVICPICGTKKTWYTADNITRAMYQLVDALSGVIVRRSVSIITKEITYALNKMKEEDKN